jgi:hypothetical protein
MRSRDCLYGVKKDGDCKKKPGPKTSKKSIQSCKKKLSEKIRINMREYNEYRRYKNRKQAIAVAYSIVKKTSPICKKVFKDIN